MENVGDYMQWDLKKHLKTFSKNDKGQMLLLSGFIIVLGLITYTSLLNEMIFTTNTPQTGQDLSKNDIKQLRTLLVEQAQVASNYALYKNITTPENGDIEETYKTFMNPLEDAAKAYHVGQGASVDIEINSINGTNDTASLLPSTLFVRDNMAPHTFSNQSIIIPMDDKQKNIMPVYGMIWNITNDFGIPVYQLIQDPRGEAWDWENNKSESYSDFDINITTNDTAFDNSSIGTNTTTVRDYAGGPYVIDSADLNATIEERLEGFNNGTYTLTTHGTVPGTHLRFRFKDDIVEGTNYSISFNMSDGSWKTVNLTFESWTNPIMNITSSGSDAEHLQFNVSETEIDDDNLKQIYISNDYTTDIEIDNITVSWWWGDPNSWGGDTNHLRKILIGGGIVWSYSWDIHSGIHSGDTANNINWKLSKIVSSEYITMHRIWQDDFQYDKVAAIDEAPRIGIWPPKDTYESNTDAMNSYFEHSGVQNYTLNISVFSDTDYTTGDLYNYDIIMIPHSNMSAAWATDRPAIRKLVMWVKNGGVLYVEGMGVAGMDYAAQKAKQDSDINNLLGFAPDDWYGFIGVIHSNGTDTFYPVDYENMAFIGTSTRYDTSKKYQYYNETKNDPMADPGSAFNPLAQTYAPNGNLKITSGHTQAFIIVPDEPALNEIVYAPKCGYTLGSNVTTGEDCYPFIERHNPDINIIAVPINNNESYINRTTYVEAKFGDGTVIYLGSDNQAGDDDDQRERLVFNTLFSSVLRERGIYAIRDINFTIRYNNGNTRYNTTIGIESMS